MEHSLKPGTVRIFGGFAGHDTRIEVWTGEKMLPVPGVCRAAYSIEGPNQLSHMRLDFELLCLGDPLEMWSEPEQVALTVVGVTPVMLRAARIALWWEVQKARLQRITRLFR